MKKVVLYTHDLSVTYGKTTDAHDVSITAYAGESVALIGLGRAGHHAVVDYFRGNCTRCSGIARVNGMLLSGDRIGNPVDYGFFCTEPMPFGDYTITLLEDLFLLRSDVLDRAIWNEKLMESRARDLLDHVGLAKGLKTPVHTLSLLEYTQLQFAKALDLRASIILLDEDFARFPDNDLAVLDGLVARLKEEGISFILYMDGLQKKHPFADSVFLFRDGTVGKKMSSENYSEEIATRYLSELESGPAVEGLAGGTGVVSFSVSGLPLFDGVRTGVAVRGGEVMNFVSYNFSLRNQIFSQLSGDSQDKGLEVRFNGRTIRPVTLEKLMRDKIIAVRWSRGGEMLMDNLSVSDNLMLPSLKKITRFGLFCNSAAGNAVRLQLMQRDRHLPERIRDCTQYQRIEIALERWLVFRPLVIIMLDPFEHMDTQGKILTKEYIEKFAANGAAVLIVSSSKLQYQGPYRKNLRII